jgi:hypothetical protein
LLAAAAGGLPRGKNRTKHHCGGGTKLCGSAGRGLAIDGLWKHKGTDDCSVFRLPARCTSAPYR